MHSRSRSHFRPQVRVLEERSLPNNLLGQGDGPGLSSPLDGSLLAAALALSPQQVTPPVGQTSSLGILMPDTNPYGKTYGEWSALWWQWAFSQPTTANPLFDTAPVGTGQPFSNVWFLGGSFTQANVTRDVTIPANTALFFPIVNSESDNFATPPVNDRMLRQVSKKAVDQATNEFLTIDGMSVAGLDRFRTQSPAFTLGPLPDNNIYQFFGLDVPKDSTSPAEAYGIYVMLQPLSPGQHTIQFGATLPGGTGQPAFSFVVTYNITVTP